jgi:hypothetical protein
MPVVIREFEAVAAPGDESRGDRATEAVRPQPIPPAALRRPLSVLAARRARTKAH